MDNHRSDSQDHLNRATRPIRSLIHRSRLRTDRFSKHRLVGSVDHSFGVDRCGETRQPRPAMRRSFFTSVAHTTRRDLRIRTPRTQLLHSRHCRTGRNLSKKITQLFSPPGTLTACCSAPITSAKESAVTAYGRTVVRVAAISHAWREGRYKTQIAEVDGRDAVPAGEAAACSANANDPGHWGAPKGASQRGGVSATLDTDLPQQDPAPIRTTGTDQDRARPPTTASSHAAASSTAPEPGLPPPVV